MRRHCSVWAWTIRMTKTDYSYVHSSQLSCLLSPGEVALEQPIVKMIPFLFLVTRQFSFLSGPPWSEWHNRNKICLWHFLVHTESRQRSSRPLAEHCFSNLHLLPALFQLGLIYSKHSSITWQKGSINRLSYLAKLSWLDSHWKFPGSLPWKLIFN